jgi:hypothetical protein
MMYVYSEACNMDTWSGKITCVMTNYSFYACIYYERGNDNVVYQQLLSYLL